MRIVFVEFKKLFQPAMLTIAMLFFLFLACNQQEQVASKTKVSKDSISKQSREINSSDHCLIYSDLQVLTTKNKSKGNQFQLSVKSEESQTTSTIDLEELDFTFSPEVELNDYCYLFEYHLEYEEEIGNNYSITRHVFEYDTDLNNLFWKKVYRLESTRNYLLLTGADVPTETSIGQYNAKEDEITFKKILRLDGFQNGSIPSFKAFADSFLMDFKFKQEGEIALKSNIYILEVLLENFDIEDENIEEWNNLAFYLEQNLQYDQAIFLLEKVIEVDPERTVAYINMGDAYLGLNEKQTANTAYQKYVKLMQGENKEGIIPPRIVEFLNNN